MAQVYFVHCPRGIRISEAKDIIRKSCDCEIKSAARAAFFVKVNSGDLKSITTPTYGEEKQQFSVEVSQKATVANWEELRRPFFFKKGEQNGEKREYKPRSGDVVRKNDEKPRFEKKPQGEKKEYVKREPQADRKPRENQQDKPRTYRAFVLPKENVKVADVEKYFVESLKTAHFKVESKEGKAHHFFAFENLEDCRNARASFRDKPMENVVVRPFVPFHKRQQQQKKE